MTGTANALNIQQSGMVAFDGTSQFFGRTITGGTGITVTNGNGVAGNPVIATNGANDLHVATYIVNPNGPFNGTGANYSTINSAVIAALATGSPQTVFVMPGTYNEDLGSILSGSVNIVGFTGDGDLPTVTLNGRVLVQGTATVNVSNIRISCNNSFSAISLTASTTTAYFNNCYFSINSSSVSFASITGGNLNFYNCRGDTTASNVIFLLNVGSNTVNIYDCIFKNSGGANLSSVFASTHGTINIVNSSLFCQVTLQTNSVLNMQFSNISTNAINLAAITSTSSGAIVLKQCNFTSGTASCITASNSLTIDLCDINSSNTNALTGGGTINFSNLSFSGSSSTINTTTQVPFVVSNNAIKLTTPGAYPYTTLPQDAMILVDTSTARTINLEASPATGTKHVIKDNTGSAFTNNITVTPAAGNIDGSGTFVMNSNYQSITIVYNGTQWNIV